MREHQIVITLKPEQFQEVQRLSRAAGAKSMGMYVRQKLLLALGIEGVPRAVEKPSPNPDLKHVSSELKRLHGELKAFVAEPLDTYYVEGQLVGGSTPPPEAASLGVTDNLPIVLNADTSLTFYMEDHDNEPGESIFGVSEPPAFDQSQDRLEQLARRAFAISPRLGPLELSASSDPSLDDRVKQLGLRKDPLEELLEEEDAPDKDCKTKVVGIDPEVAADSLNEEDDDDEETFDVPLALSDKPRTARKPPIDELPPPPAVPPGPSTGPLRPGFSGGPPPRKRQ